MTVRVPPIQLKDVTLSTQKVLFMAERSSSTAYRFYLQLLVWHHLARHLPTLRAYARSTDNEHNTAWLIAALNKYEIEEHPFWENSKSV